MLALLVKEEKPLYQAIRQQLFSIVYTLLAEDAYSACIGNPDFSPDEKYHLTEDLQTLHDSGADPRREQHFPALESLWMARDGSSPGFGSMTGAAELIRISMEMGDDWKEFIVTQLENEETLAALEEFLFGLSWEEIRLIRARLEIFGAHALGQSEIGEFLDQSPVYTFVDPRSPRAICDFFIDRREMASHRKLVMAKGPYRTLEELYLCFRLSREAKRSKDLNQATG
jgi:hypothetical protein